MSGNSVAITWPLAKTDYAGRGPLQASVEDTDSDLPTGSSVQASEPGILFAENGAVISAMRFLSRDDPGMPCVCPPGLKHRKSTSTIINPMIARD